MRIKSSHKVAIAGIIIIVLIPGGLLFRLRRTPLIVMGSGMPNGELFDNNTAVGRVFDELKECGEQQKNLFSCIEAYREKNGRLPDNMDALINDIRESMAFRNCPSDLTWYEVHIENYGRPDAVLIEEAQNKHPTAFKLWIRGVKPCVQTMGDGTVHLFEGGKLATIQARKNNDN
ncbi:MAG: hypothetical protein A2168_04690 [Planctomycetes bacterium RBG_13_50_24]|nr:MAG: hypothetical protein A2168_04690 [Planctomycetes bacterium RBG_13_50_24]